MSESDVGRSVVPIGMFNTSQINFENNALKQNTYMYASVEWL